jgi:hypothetical protein
MGYVACAFCGRPATVVRVSGCLEYAHVNEDYWCDEHIGWPTKKPLCGWCNSLGITEMRQCDEVITVRLTGSNRCDHVWRTHLTGNFPLEVCDKCGRVSRSSQGV